MTVAVEQMVAVNLTRAIDVPVAPLAAGNLVVIAGMGTQRPLSTVAFDGVVVPASFHQDDAMPAIGAPLWASWWVRPCTAGVTTIRVIPESHGPFARVAVFEISGVALIAPWERSWFAGSATPVSFTPPPVDDPARMLGILLANDATGISSDWSTLDSWSFFGNQGSLVVYEDVPAGTPPVETWAYTPVSEWALSVLPVQAIGLRVPSARGYAQPTGIPLRRPGHVEEPTSVTPGLAPLVDLPPTPQPVVVPGAPWIPGPGRQYRPRVKAGDP